MAGDSIGSVSVDIRGDYSRLQADFAGAQAAATKAGAGIASGVNAGLSLVTKGTQQLSLNLAHTTEDLFATAKAGQQLGFQFAAVNQGATTFGATQRVLAKSIAEVWAGLNAEKTALGQTTAAAAGAVPAINAVTGALERQAVAASHGVSQIQATSGAIRVLEGSQAIRAAERFLATTVGLGPAFQKMFGLIGAVAFLEIIGRVVGKIREMAAGFNESDEKIRAGFADLISSGQAANDQLQLSNDKLRQEIALLEGTPGNGLQVALDQLIISADELAESLAKDQKAVIALISANQMGLPGQMVMGTRQQDTEKELIRFQKEIDKITSEGTGKVRSAATPTSIGGVNVLSPDLSKQIAVGARTEMNTKLTQAYSVELEKLNHLLKLATAPGAIDAAAVEMLRGAIATAQTQMENIGKRGEQTTLQLRKSQLDKTAKPDKDTEAEDLKKAFAQQLDDLKSDHRLSIQEEIDFWQSKAAFTAQGGAKLAELTHQIQNTIAKLQLDSGDEAERAASKTAAAWFESFSAILTSAKDTYKQISDAAEKSIQTTAKVSEIQAAGKGRTDAAAIDNQKLQAQLAYAQQLSHSRAQEIAFAQSQAGFDTAARNAKIAGLNAELAIAQKIADDDQRNVEVSRIQAQVAEQVAKGQNDTLAALIKQTELEEKLNDAYQARRTIAQAVADWNQIGLSRLKLQFAQAAVQVPGAIGGAVASGIFDSGKKGMDIGAQIGAAMKNIGKQLLGEVIADMLKKLLAEMILHTGLQAALNALFPAVATGQTAVLLAGLPVPITSGILAANAVTTATGAAAGGVAAAGGGIAAGAGGAASSATSGLVGPLIAAAGGIIGGVISGVMSLIGAHQIVTAIHGTTAAVQALHGTVSAPGAGTLQPGAAATATTPAASSGSVMSDIGRKLFGSDNSAGGTPVRIVGIGQASAGGTAGLMEGLFGFGGGDALPVKIVSGGALGQGGIASVLGSLVGGFLGFASGGRPPLGMASLVGENGPELFIPDQAGQIIPAGKFGGAGVALPSISGVSSSQSQSIGELHVHAHGVTNPKEFVRQVARELPNYLKTTNPVFSPASH